MPWMPSVPRDPDAPSHGTDSSPPIAAVLHRTIGHWGGDYTVIKRDGLAHFLVGQDVGQWVQFADTDNFEWHAGGANDWSVGVEFSGQNGEALTGWQIEAGGKIIRWLSNTYGIPYDYDDGTGGRNGPVNKFVAHNYVSEPEDQHTDAVNRDDFDAMTHDAPAKPKNKESDMVIYHNVDVHDPNVDTAAGEWVAMYGADGPINISASEMFAHVAAGVAKVEGMHTGNIVGVGVRGAQARKASAFWDTKTK